MRIGIYATFYRSHAACSSLYTSVFQSRHTGMGAGIQDVGRKCHLALSLEPTYSGLFRDVYKDERGKWERGCLADTYV